MIEYDYTLKREGKTHVPKYPTSLENLVCIEGENSTGKSTLLHLLALGCYGDKYGIVNESLRKKIQGLVDGDGQSLEFHIDISDDTGSTVLSMQKALSGPEVVVRDAAGKPLSSDRFNRQYRLIYDIPEDPVNRLPKLLGDIKQMQQDAGDRVRRLREACHSILQEMEDSLNPERIAQREEEIQQVKKKKAEIERKLGGQREALREVVMFTALKFYTVHSDRAAQLKKGIAEAKKAGTKQKREEKAASAELDELTEAIRQGTSTLDDLYHTISIVLRDLYAAGKTKAHWQAWAEASVRDEMVNPEVITTLRREGACFLELLQAEQEKLSDSKGIEEARLLQELIDLLGKYEDSAVEIPGARLTVKKFSELLQDELGEHEGVIARVDSVKRTSDQMKQLLELRADLAVKIARCRELAADGQLGAAQEVGKEVELADLEQNLMRVEKKIDYYRHELEALGIEAKDIKGFYSDIVLGKGLKELQPYQEKELLERITDLRTSISQAGERIAKADGNLDQLEKELRRLRRREPHEHQGKADKLKQVMDTLLRMQSHLKQCEQVVQVLIDIQHQGKKPSSSVSGDLSKTAYYAHVSRYLGKRIGEVWDVDSKHEVSSVDLIKGVILTTDGHKIKLDWMGTGQGQSAYLVGLLGGYDGRKIIALFDEVAMMDSRSLGSVTDRLKSLYKEGKLLVGVIVQRGDEFRVTSIG